jgi:uncharacterized protein GlcG (DUF336 family)
MFFGGGIVIKLGDETIGAIGASGAPGAVMFAYVGSFTTAQRKARGVVEQLQEC